MATVLETLEIQFKASTGNVLSEARKVQKALKGIQLKKIKINADSKDAAKKITTLRKQIGAKAPNLRIGADTNVATKKLRILGKQKESLSKKEKINVDTREAEKKIGGLTGKFGDMIGMLKGAGLLYGAKKGLDIAFNLVNVSSNAEQVMGKMKATLGGASYEMLEKYINNLSGFNQTNMFNMASQFVTLFKAYGNDEAKSTDNAMRLIKQAIDYASFFNMTPAEAGAYFMSMLKGSYEVGDSIGMPLNATMLDKYAKEQGITGKNDMAVRAQAFVSYAENNANLTGITGDWDRTKDQYANMVTILGEQWQTLKENAGQFLLPAATTIVTALNDIVTSVNSFASGDKTFGDDVSAYFGNVELDRTTIDAIINNIVNPLKSAVDEYAKAKSAMDQSVTALKKSYHDLINTIYGGNADGTVTGAEEDKIGIAFGSLRESTTQATTKGKESLTAMFLQFANTDSPEWAEMNSRVIADIESFYDGIEEKMQKGIDDIAEKVRESIKLYGKVTPDILAEIGEMQNTSKEMFLVQSGAAGQMYLDRSGGFDKPTFDALLKGYKEETAKARAEYDRAFSEAYGTTYAMAEYNIRHYDGEGPKPLTGEEATASMKAGYKATLKEFDTDAINNISAELYGTVSNTIADMAKNGIPNNAKSQIFQPFVQGMEDSAPIMAEMIASGTASEETKGMYETYKLYKSMMLLDKMDGLSQKAYGPSFKDDQNKMIRDFYYGASNKEIEDSMYSVNAMNTTRSLTGEPVEQGVIAGAFDSASNKLDEIKSVLAQIRDKKQNVSLNIGSYKFAAAGHAADKSLQEVAMDTGGW